MMIDPILFTIQLGGFRLAVHWYGILVMTAILVATWLSTRELQRRGGDPEWIWDALPWILISGVVGARLWYVANNILGGGTRYLENPLSIFNIPEGGLHIFGGFLFGGGALLVYASRHKIDLWMFLDAIAPNLLIGQALARPANFINQELYGPPTSLPWGIPIDANYRIAPWNDLAQYPLDTTRFHPTFAYEMIWNFAAAGLLIWLSRRFEKQMRPGVIFFGWMILAGVGRALIETFRPDQPGFPGTGLSYSRLVSLLLALAGLVLLLGRYQVIRLPFWPAETATAE
ncbi:MAG: prolipoprotein diacylglyceryl transferase [Chloroflexi bacterium]|nr:prolipoprotein diacylglyceryl transferase [Anaerolineaceae bacterium]NMB90190.1 prolipoprotein diacylglyceryl transferase [Chloroflexota bacterium]